MNGTGLSFASVVMGDLIYSMTFEFSGMKLPGAASKAPSGDRGAMANSAQPQCQPSNTWVDYVPEDKPVPLPPATNNNGMRQMMDQLRVLTA